MSESLIRQFVDLLYPPSRGGPDAYFSLWEMPGRKSYHFRLSDPELEIAAHALDQEGHNVFYGVGLRRMDLGPHVRGSKPDIVALPGFWADIDLKGLNHAADNLPANLVDVIQGILEPFDWEPSAIVNSGGGLHAYWLFEQPLQVTDENRSEVEEMSRAFQERLALGARQQGWKWDMTADLARVLRPVGTHNRKHEPVPVEFMGTPGRMRYSYALFAQALKTKKGPIASLLGREHAPAPTSVPPRNIDTRTPTQILDDIRTKMRRNRKVERVEILNHIREGEPFAEPGERDKILQRVCSWIGFYDPVGEPEILVEVLRPSLEVMAAMHPDGAMTLDNAIDKIARAQSDARRKEMQSQAGDERIRSALQKLARGDAAKRAAKQKVDLVAVPPPPSSGAKPAKDALSDLPPPQGPPALMLAASPAPETVEGLAPPPEGRYDFSEIDGFRGRQSQLSGNLIGADEWKKRWVIMHGDAFFVFRNGRYLTPIPRNNFHVSAQRDIFYVLPEFDLDGRYYWNHQTLKQDDTLRTKTVDEILSEIATVARHMVADLSIPESYYDSDTETFYEAVCPLRTDLEPRYDKHIHAWLQRLGGAEAEKLFDWIATITYLQAPSCGLFISGPPDVGKSLLANGLARLWHDGGYTRMDDVVGSFNADIARCPLVVADESLPEGPNGKPISTKKLRDIISADTRPLRRKFMNNVSLTGTIRCMFLANSEKLLDLGDETMGADSLAAVASRFLHIAATGEPSDYIKSIGGRHGGTKDWVSGDLIARHALWLRDNRNVIPDGRFWVAGHASKMHQMLATASTVNGLVVEWIVRYLMRPKIEIKASRGVLVGNGQLLINTNVVGEFWLEYIKNKLSVPAIGKIKAALEGLSVEKDSVRILTDKGRKRYWPIRVSTVLAWARESGVGDVEDLQSLINTEVVGGFGQLIED